MEQRGGLVSQSGPSMRAPALCLLAGLLGCVPIAGQEPAVATRRDPLASYFGLPDSRFGTSLAWCPDAGYLVGMPGNGMVMSLNQGSGLPTFITVESGVGLAVACGQNPTGGAFAFAAGDGGAFRLLPDGGAVLLVPEPAVALSWDGERLIVGAPPAVWLTPSRAITGDAGGSFGAAVLQIPGFVVVGTPEAGSVTVLQLDGGVRSQFGPSAPASRFGTTLAWGVVTPGAGPQLLVGAPGEQRVYVYRLVDGAPDTPTFLSAPGTTSALGFGASLALEPLHVRDAGALYAVWVGAPDGEEVDQFVNGELVHQEFAPTPGSRFGAALAGAPGGVAVGAPEASAGNGAVYLVDSTIARPSELRVCLSDSTCAINCRVGTCYGGALCVEPACALGNCGCAQGFVCNQRAQVCEPEPDAGTDDAGQADAGAPDAGEPDAGEPDAGLKPDAGERDAGPKMDAGTPDAGTPVAAPVSFTTSGCSAAPGFWLACVGLLVLRRRALSR